MLLVLDSLHDGVHVVSKLLHLAALVLDEFFNHGVLMIVELGVDSARLEVVLYLGLGLLDLLLPLRGLVLHRLLVWNGLIPGLRLVLRLLDWVGLVRRRLVRCSDWTHWTSVRLAKWRYSVLLISSLLNLRSLCLLSLLNRELALLRKEWQLLFLWSFSRVVQIA